MKVKMKKATLAVMADELQTAVKALQKCGEFMIISQSDGEALRTESDESYTDSAENALSAYGPYRKKRGLLYCRPEYTAEELEREDTSDRQSALLAVELKERMDALENSIQRLNEQNARLEPFMALSLDGAEANGTEYTEFICGRYKPSQKDMSPFEVLCEENDVAPTVFYEDTKGVRYVYLHVFKGQGAQFSEAAQQSGLEPLALPYKNGTPQDERKRIMQELDALTQELEKTGELLAAEAEKADRMELFCDRERIKDQRRTVIACPTQRTAVIYGWVREDRTQRVEKAIRSACDAYHLEFADPADDEQAPTVTKSNKFVEQYSCITNAFSVPGASDVDPNPVMAVWYFIIFGMMMGDVGYGALMAILLTLFKKLKKPRGNTAKLVNVMLYSSITAIIFGFAFGSFFGNTLRLYPLDPPTLYLGVETPTGPYKDLCLINPQTDITGTLIITLVLGALHIFTGMIVKAVMLIKEGKWLDAVCDQFSWIVMITGIGLVFLGGTAATVGMIAALAMVVLILLTGGRKKKGAGKIIGGLGALYGATSFLSDILSYSRILALCLSTSIIGWVMNMLAGMVCSAMPNIILGVMVSVLIYALGHGINFALGLLSAYVHTCRLQYIEFFGKFYDGGGVEFKPLKADTQYVDVVDIKDNEN